MVRSARYPAEILPFLDARLPGDSELVEVVKEAGSDGTEAEEEIAPQSASTASSL